jgi:hypothetical protein
MIASTLSSLAWRRFRAACRRPLAAQAVQLRRILSGAVHTDVGARHAFARIARIRDAATMIRTFQHAVPARAYGEMKDELDAVYAGRWQSLCPSRPLWFAMTAGSTGEYKYVPVTAEYRREVGRSSMIFQGALEAAFPEGRRLKTQFLVGSAEGGLSPGGIPQGFASGFNYKNLPGFVRRRFVAPYWIFTLDDAEERAYAAGRVLVAEPGLGVLCAISPVNLINLREALERNAERLFTDVEAGTLTVCGSAAVPGAWSCAPDPERARALRAAWQTGGGLPTRQLFPSLRTLVCWQGGNMSYYLDELRRSFGIDDCFEFPLSASEGVFAIPFRANRPGGVIAVTTHFLEFLPESAAGTSGALRANELEAGREYRLVVSNAGGLYRYDMEDIVRVTSFLDATPVIEFISKKDRQVSVSNERITERDVTVAFEAAARRCGCWLPEFLFVPCSDRRYRLVLDGASCAAAGMAANGTVQALAVEVERQLRAAAKGYDFEREDRLLEPVQILVTAPDQLTDYFRHRRREDLPNAQIKPMHLTNEFDVHVAFTVEASYAA